MNTRTEIRDRFLRVDTANVSDVLDTMGLRDQSLASLLVPFSTGRIAGFAYTIMGEVAPYEEQGDAAKMDACDGVSDSEVTIWSGQAEGVCYFGELIALGMMERGSVGAVLDGGIRDVRWLEEHGFPVYAAYRTPTQSIHRWKVTGWQSPVYMPGATSQRVIVHPGDFVLGDEDGIIIIPAAYIEEVLSEAERMTASEIEIRRALQSGMSLTEALDAYGHV